MWDQHNTNLKLSFKSLCFAKIIQKNLGGRSSLVSESRVAKERELEGSLASWVLSKEKTFRLVEMGTHKPSKCRMKSLDI